MKSIYKRVIVVIVGILLILVVFALLNGWFSVSKDTHPPCDQLPDIEETTEALANHQDFAEEITALGDHIEVKVGKPCGDDRNRGLVKVIYSSKSERDAVSDLLKHSEGFGVPVYLVKR